MMMVAQDQIRKEETQLPSQGFGMGALSQQVAGETLAYDREEPRFRSSI